MAAGSREGRGSDRRLCKIVGGDGWILEVTANVEPELPLTRKRISEWSFTNMCLPPLRYEEGAIHATRGCGWFCETRWSKMDAAFTKLPVLSRVRFMPTESRRSMDFFASDGGCFGNLNRSKDFIFPPAYSEDYKLKPVVA